MTHKKSVFAELIERRIPQILGMYVAAVWLAVEIGDWMSERFDVPAQVSSYVFVIMISFLPLVALLAWGHGRPGKDKWTQKQIIFIPFNLILVYFSVNAFIKPAVQATEVLSIVDEQTGQMVEFEVAKSGLNQKVAGFFWENKTNDEELEWLSYGAMWLISQDLLRTPIISIQTPYDSDVMLGKIRNRGYKKAIGEPLSLDLSIANDKDAQWLIKGQISKDGSQLEFKAFLYEVVTGALVTTVTSTQNDWLFALDDVAEQLGEFILSQANIKPSLIPDLSISDHVSKNLDAIHAVIKSLNAVKFDNDFSLGVEFLKAALDADRSLAEAHVLLVDYYRSIGDLAAAEQSAEEALKFDDKLYQESVFKVKANYYAVKGEQNKAIRVLENWVTLYPESANALQALGSNYIVVGHRLDDAFAVYDKLIALQEGGSDALLNQARIYRLKNNEAEAMVKLNAYLELNQDKPEAYMEMASAYLQFGNLQAAKEMYEEASLFSTTGIDADLGLAKIMSLSGDIEKSLNEMNQLLDRAGSDVDKVKVLTEIETILSMTGQFNKALLVVEKIQSLSRSFMPPLTLTLSFGSKQVAYMAYLQQFDEAWGLYEQLLAETNPPFDKMLALMGHNIAELQGDDVKTTYYLKQFEAFLAEFQMTVYDQFVYSSHAIELRKAGEYEQALRLHDQAIEESMQSIFTLNTLHVVDSFYYEKAKTLLAAGQNEAVIALMNETLQRSPLFGQCMVLKAHAQLLSGRIDEANKTLQQLKALWVNADVDSIDLIKLKALENQLQQY